LEKSIISLAKQLKNKMTFLDITYNFILPILSVIGFVFNLLTTIVFSLIIKNGQKDDMFKHLLFKAICEMMGCLLSAFYPMYYYKGSLSYTFMMVLWRIWFQNYIIPALFMASTGFEIAATFSCAISIEKKMKWCEKRFTFWTWVVSILILSFGVEIYPALMYHIVETKKNDHLFNKTVHSYIVRPNIALYKNKGKFGLGESIIKEVIFMLILLSLNIHVLYKLIRIRKIKKRLNTNSSIIQNSMRAENRKIIMIIVLFLTFLLGHLPNVVYFGVNIGYVVNLFWMEFFYFAVILLYLSYSTSFFVYFWFNNIFKRCFLKIIRF
jgi:hypothetical protein